MPQVLLLSFLPESGILIPTLFHSFDWRKSYLICFYVCFSLFWLGGCFSLFYLGTIPSSSQGLFLDHSWQCSVDPIGCQESDPDWPQAKKLPYLLCFLSSPKLKKIFLLESKVWGLRLLRGDC